MKQYKICMLDQAYFPILSMIHEFLKCDYRRKNYSKWMKTQIYLTTTKKEKHPVIQANSSRNTGLKVCLSHREPPIVCLWLALKFHPKWHRRPPEHTSAERLPRRPCLTSVPVHVIWQCHSFASPSDSAKHLNKGSNWVHAVEKVQRNGKTENCAPRSEAKCLLFQAVVVLRSAAEGQEDPQLEGRKKCYLLN